MKACFRPYENLFSLKSGKINIKSQIHPLFHLLEKGVLDVHHGPPFHNYYSRNSLKREGAMEKGGGGMPLRPPHLHLFFCTIVQKQNLEVGGNSYFFLFTFILLFYY
nr:hypothetical protein [Morchella crassipes]